VPTLTLLPVVLLIPLLLRRTLTAPSGACGFGCRGPTIQVRLQSSRPHDEGTEAAEVRLLTWACVAESVVCPSQWCRMMPDPPFPCTSKSYWCRAVGRCRWRCLGPSLPTHVMSDNTGHHSPHTTTFATTAHVLLLGLLLLPRSGGFFWLLAFCGFLLVGCHRRHTQLELTQQATCGKKAHLVSYYGHMAYSRLRRSMRRPQYHRQHSSRIAAGQLLRRGSAAPMRLGTPHSSTGSNHASQPGLMRLASTMELMPPPQLQTGPPAGGDGSGGATASANGTADNNSNYKNNESNPSGDTPLQRVSGVGVDRSPACAFLVWYQRLARTTKHDTTTQHNDNDADQPDQT
jgi:hypothetical protein